MQKWVKVPMTILLQRNTDGIGANNLIIVIMETLQKGGRLNPTSIIHKFFCFGVDGVST
jgi:hypothetical protein